MFWRAVWFSRYAWTPHQVQYYRWYLTQWEVGLSMTRGEPGRQELLSKCRRKLEASEQIIRGMNNPRMAFRLHWLHERFGDE